MTKNEVKKLKRLQLSRETLHALASSDIQKVVGGGSNSCQSACFHCDEISKNPETCVLT